MKTITFISSFIATLTAFSPVALGRDVTRESKNAASIHCGAAKADEAYLKLRTQPAATVRKTNVAK